ncbi:MAG: hypothetical protein IKZ10_07575 [Akkermansia sp.]|nr:hypothetical protein [Akkermansia sp.]
MKKLHLIPACVALFCCSCAYMQSNKNITEGGVHYEGCKLDTDTMALCRKGSQWYIESQVKTYSKRYPLFHDSILLADNNAPQYQEAGTEKPMVCYLPISDGTAATLQMRDGYANASDLAGEIHNKMKNTPVVYGNAAGPVTRHAISAHIEQNEEPAVITFKQCSEASWARRTLAKADFVLVDIPGTLAYNVAIPIMAPIIFFSEFFSNED